MLPSGGGEQSYTQNRGSQPTGMETTGVEGGGGGGGGGSTTLEILLR